MDRIERLNRREEAALQVAAERYVGNCDGDVMRALKTMMLLNRDLQEELDALRPAPVRRPATVPQRPRQQQFTF